MNEPLDASWVASDPYTGHAGNRAVDLVINAHRMDLGFLEPTVRHLSRALHAAPLLQRTLLLDTSDPLGRFSESDRPDADRGNDQLRALAHRLVTDGVIDRVDEIDWSEAKRRAVMQRWYGDPEAPTRCAAGTPIYQFCSAVDRGEADYVLHLDSDMLLHSPDGGVWVAEAVAQLAHDESAFVAMPMGGPPMATTLAELIFGPRARPTREQQGWVVGGDFSSRVFVVDRRRLHERGLPLRPDHLGDTWERAMTTTARRRGFHRLTLADEARYAIHPRTHNAAHRHALADLIWAVERDVAPFRRTGHRWDIRTDGRHLLPWRLAIMSTRIADRLARTSVGGRARFGGAGA